jgi:hypothetical protein
VELTFRHHGVEGRVVVDYRRNVDPGAVGCLPDTRDFPACTALVEYPMRGYESLMGWVQLVRSDDNVSGGKEFEIDPLAFLGDLPHPFCWLGICPTLFDVPSRSPRRPMQWTARSYLCVPDDIGEGLGVYAMLGFAWGFRIEGAEVVMEPPRPLEASAWDEHLPSLSEGFPDWRFPSGFRQID